MGYPLCKESRYHKIHMQFLICERTKNPHWKDKPETKETGCLQGVDWERVGKARGHEEGMTFLSLPFHITLTS